MVSKASEDLPEPETPETTVSFPWGMEQSTFFRLWVRAPRMMISSVKEIPGACIMGEALERSGGFEKKLSSLIIEGQRGGMFRGAGLPRRAGVAGDVR